MRSGKLDLKGLTPILIAVMPESPLDNVIAMVEAFEEYRSKGNDAFPCKKRRKKPSKCMHEGGFMT